MHTIPFHTPRCCYVYHGVPNYGSDRSYCWSDSACTTRESRHFLVVRDPIAHDIRVGLSRLPRSRLPAVSESA